jgi:hypothetical protein
MMQLSCAAAAKPCQVPPPLPERDQRSHCKGSGEQVNRDRASGAKQPLLHERRIAERRQQSQHRRHKAEPARNERPRPEILLQ